MTVISESSLPGLSAQLKRRNMTAYRLAKELGWKPGTINRYVKGERSPSKWRRDAICRILDCSTEELFITRPEK